MYKYSNGYKHVLKFLRNKGDYIKFFYQIIKSLLQYIYYVVIYVFKYLVKNVCNLCHLSKNWCEICKKKNHVYKCPTIYVPRCSLIYVWHINVFVQF